MGTASAIPHDLYMYSDKTTAANTDLQNWVKKVLISAIETYRNGARDFGHQLPGLTLHGSPTAAYGTFDQEVLRQLGPLFTADRDVRRIGEAFARADATPRITSSTTAAERSPHVLVTTTDPTVERFRSQINSADRGRRLAERANEEQQLDKHTLDMLQKYSKDPHFVGSFLNGLRADHLVKLLNRGFIPEKYHQAIVDAIVLAYANGLVDQDTAASIWLSSPYLSAPQGLDPQLILAIKKNSAAAYHFIKSLSDDNLLRLLQNTAYLHQIPELTNPMADLIAIFALGLSQAPPEERQAFYDRVSRLIQQSRESRQTVTVDDTLPVLRSVSLLTIIHLNQRLPPPPPDASHEELLKWAEQIGEQVKTVLAPWNAWIDQIGDRQERDETAITDLINYVTGVVVGIWTLPYKAIVGFIVGAVTSGFTTWSSRRVLDSLGITDPKVLANADQADLLRLFGIFAARVAAVTHLIAAGRVLRDGRPVTMDDLYDVIANPGLYKVAGTDGSNVSTYFYEIDNSAGILFPGGEGNPAKPRPYDRIPE